MSRPGIGPASNTNSRCATVASSFRPAATPPKKGTKKIRRVLVPDRAHCEKVPELMEEHDPEHDRCRHCGATLIGPRHEEERHRQRKERDEETLARRAGAELEDAFIGPGIHLDGNRRERPQAGLQELQARCALRGEPLRRVEDGSERAERRRPRQDDRCAVDGSEPPVANARLEVLDLPVAQSRERGLDLEDHRRDPRRAHGRAVRLPLERRRQRIGFDENRPRRLAEEAPIPAAERLDDAPIGGMRVENRPPRKYRVRGLRESDRRECPRRRMKKSRVEPCHVGLRPLTLDSHPPHALEPERLDLGDWLGEALADVPGHLLFGDEPKARPVQARPQQLVQHEHGPHQHEDGEHADDDEQRLHQTPTSARHRVARAPRTAYAPRAHSRATARCEHAARSAGNVENRSSAAKQESRPS